VPLTDMSPHVIDAFVVTEDKRFYDHNGIDYVRVFGAIKNNILAGRFAEGFSTITMQLAGNLWPEEIDRRDRSPRRKLREARVALEIERRYPKEKILELYLNQIDLGNRAFGVEAASQRYFGKSVRDLNPAEAAMLAALPKAPSRYNPRRHPDLAVQRRNVVLNLLRDNGKLSEDEAERWKAYPLGLSSLRNDYSSVAQYFVEMVRQQLQARFGDDLYKEGLRIYTTLDLDMQQAAERALRQQLEAIEGGRFGRYPHQSYSEYMDAKAEEGGSEQTQTPYLQGLAVTIEAKTGYIRALVGGRDFEDSKFNRAVQSHRQPGSTFKPFVYSAAIRAGYPLSYVVVDEPLAVELPDQPTWTPQNYELDFRGPSTLREHLKWSRNIPAIKLGMELGPAAVVAEATRFGITTRIPRVPSIYIGAADVIPLEMVAAYTAFANLGVRTLPTAILRVEDRAGNIVWQPPVRTDVVMSREHAWLMVDALRDVVLRGSASGRVGAQIDFPAGGKTGTTNDGNDVWFIGFTPDLVSGVWIGFDQPQKIMANAQGGRLAAPAWTDMMKEIYERRPKPQSWSRPPDLTFAEIDKTTGYRATPFCPREVHFIESFLPGTEPQGFCPVHSSPFMIGGAGAAPAAVYGGSVPPIDDDGSGVAPEEGAEPEPVPDR
ncbi:MAG: PBP1A family penicillin-binding protein, partial [Gemmatimonadota bacterium]|nr:PBP1A family penicillin-binding protein [Gemmatimonadota bacterium]